MERKPHTSRSDLCLEVAQSTGVSVGTVDKVVIAALEIISREVVEERRVIMSNFGTFEGVKIPKRKRRDLYRGEEIETPEQVRCRFRPTGALHRALRSLDPEALRVKKRRSLKKIQGKAT